MQLISKDCGEDQDAFPPEEHVFFDSPINFVGIFGRLSALGVLRKYCNGDVQLHILIFLVLPGIQ